jgi:2-polyprenyl-3-methyl-5-hydroxy-6-metoxy-1,4-benzoquinol methylase
LTLADRDRWDARYSEKAAPADVCPDEWLTTNVANVHPGRAIDLACGIGHNAIWLAERGWQVDAIDISSIGLGLAQQFATRHGVTVNWIEADLDQYEVATGYYTMVTVFRFLDRVHVPSLIAAALCPGGLLIYETFSRAQMDRADNHLKNVDFTVAPDEWKHLFPNFEILREQQVELADRSVSRLLARKH